MKKKFEIDVNCKVSRTVNVFADDWDDACEKAKQELEEEINSYVDDSDIEDLEASCNDDGKLWGFTSETQYDSDRSWYEACEDMWHRGEYLYHASEQGDYVLVWRKDEHGSRMCHVVKGSIEELTAEVLDKIFGLVECDDADEYCSTYEYEHIEWDDDDDEYEYRSDEAVEWDDTMPHWLTEDVDDIKPLYEWKNDIDVDALRTTLTEKYSNEFIPRVGFDDDFDTIINDAINWGIDNHESEECTIEESADAFVIDRVEYNKMWRNVHSLNKGDIVLIFHRVKDNDDLAYGWHMVEFYDDNIGSAELYDGMKNQFMFKDAQCVYDGVNTGIDSYKSIGLNDIGKLVVVRSAEDTDRIKTLEYQLEQIKAVFK